MLLNKIAGCSACLVIAIFIADASAQRQQDGRRTEQDSRERQLPEELKFEDGVAEIPDWEMFERLSYQGPDVSRDAYLAHLQFVKFQIEDVNTDEPLVYFMNTKTRRAHPQFMSVIGIQRRGGNGQMRGALTFRPLVNGPTGEPGIYTFDFQPNDAFPYEMIQLCHDLLIEKAPVLKDRLVYHPLQGGLSRYEREKEQYAEAGLPVYLDDDLFSDIGFLPLNAAESYGRLRVMESGELPSSRDIVLYRALPNELPRVAGIITTVPQTPLSHVNLRAVQDQVPNAYVQQADDREEIESLVGKLVYYCVTLKGYEIREARNDEVEAYFANLRPEQTQIPVRDLSIDTPMPLDEISFNQSDAFGVKAANVAAMREFDLPEGTVPDGFGVPFYFYDQFMKHNDFYAYAEKMMAVDGFADEQGVRQSELESFRELILQGEMPQVLLDSLAQIQDAFGEGASIRCRSSTNNEDLPGFSGAGLYDSCTHRVDEGHLANSIKQVYASLWNFRAFEEREFYRVDHLAAAMGVLLHPNYSNEIANGVAVTQDILYQTAENSYLNVQVGEDLVTNPEAESSPEELLLGWSQNVGHRVMRYSNQVEDGEQLLSNDHVREMRDMLNTIHIEFSKLYGVSQDAREFAMEIEFKITHDNKIAIKQARPWVW